jgi:hypothetical protein
MHTNFWSKHLNERVPKCRWQDNIKWIMCVDSLGLGKELVTGCCAHGNEHSVSIYFFYVRANKNLSKQTLLHDASCDKFALFYSVSL